MLYEIKGIEQKEKDIKRRWFFDHNLDLLVWIKKRNNEITGFQLCYDKEHNPHALTWLREKGFSHNKIDRETGKIGRRRGVPMLVQDGFFDIDRVSKEFRKMSAELEKNISEFVYKAILDFKN